MISDSNHDGILQLNEFFMRPDIVVLATPEMAGLPYVISGLVAAGGLAAAMSTADGLILAIANALSHDLYYKMIDPNADARLRLIVARILLIIIGVLAALVASLQLTGILGAVAWAFDFACSGLFFPLVLGIWWKRANREGAIAGMVLGFVAGSAYLYYRPYRWRAVDRHRSSAVRHDRHAGQPDRDGGGQSADPGARRGNAADGRPGSYPQRGDDSRSEPLIVDDNTIRGRDLSRPFFMKHPVRSAAY